MKTTTRTPYIIPIYLALTLAAAALALFAYRTFSVDSKKYSAPTASFDLGTTSTDLDFSRFTTPLQPRLSDGTLVASPSRPLSDSQSGAYPYGTNAPSSTAPPSAPSVKAVKTADTSGTSDSESQNTAVNTPLSQPIQTKCTKLPRWIKHVDDINDEVGLVIYGYDAKVLVELGEAKATVLLPFDADAKTIDTLRNAGHEVGLLFEEFPDVKFTGATDPDAIAWWQEVGGRFGDHALVQTIPALTDGCGFTVPTTLHGLVSAKHNLDEPNKKIKDILDSFKAQGGDIVVVNTGRGGTKRNVELIKSLLAKLSAANLTTNNVATLLDKAGCKVKN
jgi:hypothetical protein